MKVILSMSLAVMIAAFAQTAFTAANTLTNVSPAPARQSNSPFQPGTTIILPNGQKARIESMLPNGYFITDNGLTISARGVVLEGPDAGELVYTVEETNPQGKADVNSSVALKQEAPATGITPEINNPVPAPVSPDQPETVVKTPTTPKVEPEQNPLTMAQLLPLTDIRQKKKEVVEPEKPAKEPAKEPVKEPVKKPAAKKQEKPVQPVQKPQPQAKTGQALRIPQEAINSGKLDFLAGCWQGTRPEYFSKRIIKECFCFDANGKSGKRRIYDSGRMCVGATRANLAKNGILSVTSKGAFCSDGETWGAAEMVCQNSGPKTPCSWVFTDANNGRQSYQIPFVRVESCGR